MSDEKCISSEVEKQLKAVEVFLDAAKFQLRKLGRMLSDPKVVTGQTERVKTRALDQVTKALMALNSAEELDEDDLG